MDKNKKKEIFGFLFTIVIITYSVFKNSFFTGLGKIQPM